MAIIIVGDGLQGSGQLQRGPKKIKRKNRIDKNAGSSKDVRWDHIHLTVEYRLIVRRTRRRLVPDRDTTRLEKPQHGDDKPTEGEDDECDFFDR